MSNSQKHGAEFEDFVKLGFPGSANFPRSPTAPYDIESLFDPAGGLNTSVKSAKGKCVGLGDATRNFERNEDYRLVVGSFTQVGNHKHFHTVREFLITKAEWKTLKGGMATRDVAALHETIKAIPAGQHERGRRKAHAGKRALQDSHPNASLRLNPKIDSKSQRRLQASISIDDLMRGVARSRVHTKHFRGMSLPFVVKSSPRGQVDKRR
jgi:hypothetical protein